MKKLLRAAGFVACALVALYLCSAVLKFKYTDGNAGWREFYRLPKNSVDVLVLGSSHAFETWNPAVFWEEAGVSSQVVAGSIQPAWNTLYNFAEAIKTQRPKLVVLEVYGLLSPEEYMDHSRIIKNTIGLAPSGVKVKSVLASSPAEKKWDYLLEFPCYHDRYGDLTRQDFQQFAWNEPPYYAKGWYNNMRWEPVTPPALTVTECTPLPPRQQQYLEMLLDMAQREGLPVFLFAAPYALSTIDQGWMNEVARLAEGYGVEFVDFNHTYQQTDFRYETDMADRFHVNDRGSANLTRWLAEYLPTQYALPQSRGQADREGWEECLKLWKLEQALAELSRISEPAAYLKALQALDKSQLAVVVTAAEGWQNDPSAQPLAELCPPQLLEKGTAVALGGNWQAALGQKGANWHAAWAGQDFDLAPSPQGGWLLRTAEQSAQLDAPVNVAIYSQVHGKLMGQAALWPSEGKLEQRGDCIR